MPESNFGDKNLKRFTDTNKWDDPWFWELSPTAKLLWFYLLDHCDNSGAVEFNAKIAGFKIGQPIKPEHLTELESRLKTLKSRKLWIPKFIRFQFGVLEPTNNLHRSVLKLLSVHGLRYPEDVDFSTPDQPQTISSHTPYEGSKNGTGTGKEKVQEGGTGGNHYHKDSRTALHWLNEHSHKRFREIDKNLKFISARLNEEGVNIEGVKLMIERQCSRWNGTDQAEYLRPQTLFNTEKFDSYYAAKDLPISTDSKPGKESLAEKLLREI